MNAKTNQGNENHSYISAIEKFGNSDQQKRTNLIYQNQNLDTETAISDGNESIEGSNKLKKLGSDVSSSDNKS